MDFVIGILSHWDSVVAVLLVLGGLIFFHELGHFGAARLFGIGVRTFSLGFGPKLFAKRFGKTEYCLSLIPLGGYAAMVAEEGDFSDEEAEKDRQAGIVFTADEYFNERPAWQRLIVIIAGPFANFIVAFMIYWLVAWGAGQTYLLPIVGVVNPESPAAVVGLEVGDRIERLNGQTITEWGQIAEAIATAQGQPVKFEILRKDAENTQPLTFMITPEQKTRTNLFGEEQPAWLVGIGASNSHGVYELGAGEALKAGFLQTWNMITFTLESFQKLIQRVVPMDAVGGPIMIAQVVGQQAQESLMGVLLLAALISVNLGILNLLPIPVLDGGHVVFLLAEMVFRRPVPEGVRVVSSKVGMGFLLALMVLATWNDLVRIFS